MTNVPSKAKIWPRKPQTLTTYDNSCQYLRYSKIRNLAYHLKINESINVLSIKFRHCVSPNKVLQVSGASSRALFIAIFLIQKIDYMQHQILSVKMSKKTP